MPLKCCIFVEIAKKTSSDFMAKNTRRDIQNKKEQTENSEKHPVAKKQEELEHDAQRKYIQLQLIKQQVQTYAEEKKIIDEKTQEIYQTIETLKKIADVKNNTEMWTPLGSGAFGRALLKDSENVLIAIGAGAALVEKREAAIELLEERKKELENVSTDVMGQIFQLSESAESIENDLNRIIEKLNK